MTRSFDESETCWRFGDFTLNKRRSVLLRDGHEVPLRKQAFDVLHILIVNHGRLVSREDLFSQVWPGKIVTEDSLTHCLMDVRGALGDESQEMIRTVRGRGYIFDGPVNVESESPASESIETGQVSPFKRQLRWRVAAPLVLLGAALIWWQSNIMRGGDEKTTGPDTPTTPDLSIAVLAFKDMSAEQDQEYFGDGLAEELLNVLSGIPELRVISRSSTFSYKGKNIDIPTLAKQLNVTHVLEGSVRTSKNRVRITAQLIEAQTDTHLWSEIYESPFDDIFLIQKNISEQVASELKLKLLNPVSPINTTDAEAYRLYLQASYLANRLNLGKSDQAEALFRQVLQLDPAFAPAWRELSRMLWRQLRVGPDLAIQIERTRETLERARNLAPNDAASLAYSAWNAQDFDGDIVGAARLFEQAISIAPSNEHVLRTTLLFARAFGRPEDAIAIGEYAVARNPLCMLCNFHLTRAFRDAGRLDEAAARLRDFESLFGGGLGELALIALLQGDSQAALGLAAGEEFEPKRLLATTLALYELGRDGDFAEAFAELKEVAASDKRPWEVAQAYAWLDMADEAFMALEKGAELTRVRFDGEIVRWNPLRLAIQARNPFYRKLHEDPRWQLFLERYGVSPARLADVQFRVTLPE